MRLLALLASVGALVTGGPAIGQALAPAGPSVRDVVQFTRLVQPRASDLDALRQQVSPDGSRVFIVTRKGDVASDRNRYQIQLLDLDAARLAAGRPAAPVTVFSFDADQDPYYEDPAVQRVQWWNDRSLIFLGRLKDGVHQVYRLDVDTREITQLSRVSTPIVSYAASADMRRLVYAVQVPNPAMKEGAHSIVIGNQTLWSVKNPQQRLTAQVRKYRFYVSEVGSAQPPRPLGEPFFEANHAKPQVSISPDGRWALLPRYEPGRTSEWSERYPMVKALLQMYGKDLSADPLRYYSGPSVLTLRRMVAWNLDEAREQTVVDAPDDAQPVGGQLRAARLWQGQSDSVILAGTHLPVAPGAPTSLASHVIEYWLESGRWQVIAELAARNENLYPVAGGFEVMDGERRRRFKRTDAGGWQEVTSAALPAEQAVAAWSVRIQESLDQPPDVVAVGPAQQTVRLTHLNPQFDVKTWGRVQPFAWRDAEGRPWIGGLLSAAGDAGRRKLPLVIQPYSYAPDKFLLDGPNSMGGGTSGFPGRAFVREGILMLAMSFRPLPGVVPVRDDYRNLLLFNEGIRAAVKALVADGRVDPARVGIIGWSTTGESVLNLVTFSDLPIRAATMADSDANTLFTYMLTLGYGSWPHIEALNKGLPFGATREEWLRNDPSLNTDCINTALRIEAYGHSLTPNHDIYALLRRQYKPVEMVLIPGGFHSLSTPSERMISLQGNVDWYRFWLKGERRTVPELAGETADSLQAQYTAWEQMLEMKTANDAKPRCSREPSRG